MRKNLVRRFRPHLIQFGNSLFVKITNDFKAKSKSEWMCDRIEVQNIESGAVYIFNAGEWIHGSDSIQLSAANEDIAKVNYKVEVKTSDKFGAGTDANVTMKLTGANG